MAFANVGLVFALNIFLAILCIINSQDVPPVKLRAFKPKGFRAYVDDTQYLNLFIFHGHVNKPIQTSDVGTLSGEVHRATAGKWIFEDTELQLKVGDVINYYVFVSFETIGYLNSNLNYLKDNLTYTVTELEELDSPAPTGFSTPAQNSSKCKGTLTKIYGGRTACAGETIFEENFDTLKENLWQIEQYIPIHHNEIPFVSYQRLPTNPTVTVINGTLRITPTLQQNVPGYNEESITSGKINLISGCTTSEVEACSKAAVGADILPPIVSGRITSKGFAFKYGTIHVRAKLPLGDWLYPEILLEPLHSNRFGRSRYSSGVLKIACVRGNTNMDSSPLVFGRRVLYGGPIMDFACRTRLLNLIPVGERWGDEFHVYSLRWDPDRITLLADGVEWGRVEPPASGLVGMFPKEECTHLQRELLGYRSKLAPFDDYFYIALGVAAGGITEFPDVTYPDNQPKPWTNAGRKAMLNFWQDMHNWITTWKQPELLVDYVRVDAL